MVHPRFEGPLKFFVQPPQSLGLPLGHTETTHRAIVCELTPNVLTSMLYTVTIFLQMFYISFSLFS